MSKYLILGSAILLALLVSVIAITKYTYPYIVLQQQKDPYLNFGIKCHQAKAISNNFEALSNELDPSKGLLLKKASKITLMDCFSHHKLRRILLSIGVAPSYLDQLDIQALENSRTPADYVLHEVGTP